MKSATTGDAGEMKRAAARVLARGGTQEDVASLLYNGWGVKLDGYEPPKEGPGMPNAWRGYGMNVLQGVTFGFGDEAVGSIEGLLTSGSAQAGRDEYRAEMQKFNAANPMSAMAAEVGGGLLLGGTGAARTLAAKGAGMGLAKRTAMGAGIGAGAGAVYGAGDTDGGLSERARGAVRGGALGAAVGTAAPLAGAAIGAAVQPIGRVGLSWVDKLRKPAETTASKAARVHWAEAIVRDHGSIDNAIAKAQKIPEGVPFALVDAGGENSLSLVQAASGLRGPGKQKLIEDMLTRQADQGDRLVGKLFRSLKMGVENAYDTADNIMAGRKSAADPLYQQAYTQQTAVTPELKKILNHPRFQEAYEHGRLIASDEDLFESANKGALKVGPLALDKNGKFTGATIPVRALDYMKRGLDNIIDNAAESKRPLDKQLGRSLRKGLNAALDAVDDVPDYKRARSVWRGETEALEALQMGKGGGALNAATDVKAQRFVNRPPEIVKRELASLSSAEQELYKVGAAQDIAEYLAETTAQAPNSAMKLGGKEFGASLSNIEKRVRAMFDDADAAQDFMDYVKAEARISRSTASLGGSVTASKQQAMADLAGGLPGKGGLWSQIAGVTVKPLMQRAKTGWTDQISDAISDLALRGQGGKAELIATLNSLRPHAPKYRPAIPAVAGQQAAQLR